MPFVLDASVALVWCFDDEHSDYAEAVREVLDRDDALVTNFWSLEIASGLRNGERRARISEANAHQRIEQLMSLRISPVQIQMQRVFESVIGLAREQALTVYDAAYLDLAMQEGLALATLDNDLLAVIRRVGVPLFDPR